METDERNGSPPAPGRATSMRPRDRNAPQKCLCAIYEAMETLEPVLKAHDLEVREQATDGAEKGWGNHRGDMLADAVFQLVPSVGELLTAVGTITDCIDDDE